MNVSDEKIYNLVERYGNKEITKTQFFYWVSTWKLDPRKVRKIVFKRELYKTLKLGLWCSFWLCLVYLWSQLMLLL